MTHAELIKACKQAESKARREAEQNYPGQVIRLSGRYLVVEPFVNFGDFRWDNSMAEFLRTMHRAQDRCASSMYITGVVNVARKSHYFEINNYLPNVATWRVDIDLTEKRPFNIDWDSAPKLYNREDLHAMEWK